MTSILIADDEPHVLRVLKMSLEKENYLVDICDNGRDALEMVLQNPPDVLITDIQMPLMDGEELCTEIQRQLPDRDMRFFVLTSRTEIEHREWSRKIDNLQFLEKPVSIRELLERLASHAATATGA